MFRAATTRRRMTSLLRQAINKFHLSPRAHDRILKVARTIADLAGSNAISAEHLLEAITYRTIDREEWAL